jgi:rubrerythrin
MPAKKKAVSKAKPKAKPKAKANPKKGDAYVCRVCGYRLVVDRACGCATMHTYVCCGRRMASVPAKKA